MTRETGCRSTSIATGAEVAAVSAEPSANRPVGMSGVVVGSESARAIGSLHDMIGSVAELKKAPHTAVPVGTMCVERLTNSTPN